MNKKHPIADYWNMGTAIGACAAIGIVLGAILGNLILWLMIGASVGTVLGAIISLHRNREPDGKLKNETDAGSKSTPGAKGRKTLKLLVFLLVAVFFGILFYPQTRGIEKNAPLEVYTAFMQERIPVMMDQYGVPGVSLALVKEGKVVWTYAYGFADMAAGQKMTVDTPMRVESISKSVTAWGIMKLVQEGKLDLDRPVVEYIHQWDFPASMFPVEAMTVRQLMCHTAGMPLGNVFQRYHPKDVIPSLEESLFQTAVLEREPGTDFYYSNVGYNLLELLIEEITGQDFATYMANEILLPLGMEQSSFLWNEGMSPEVPKGHTLKGDAVPVYVYPEKGSGGLFATAEDIAAFVAAGMPAFMNNPVLNSSNIMELYVPEAERLGVYGLVFNAYGKGYYMEHLSNGTLAVSHGGQGNGVMTHFHGIPETGDGIVILTNSQRSWPFIAHILKDWTGWRGVGPVGMERILIAQSVLWGLIGLLSTVILYQAIVLVTEVIKGKRSLMLDIRRMGLSQFAQIGVAFIVLAALIWCLCQKYLLISSVFPAASAWLAVVMGAWAALLLASALLMRNTTTVSSSERAALRSYSM